MDRDRLSRVGWAVFAVALTAAYLALVLPALLQGAWDWDTLTFETLMYTVALVLADVVNPWRLVRADGARKRLRPTGRTLAIPVMTLGFLVLAFPNFRETGWVGLTGEMVIYLGVLALVAFGSSFGSWWRQHHS